MGTAGVTDPATAAGTHAPRVGRGVQNRVESLLREYDRDWSVQEIVEAFDRRGDPLTSAAPKNAVRTALANLNKAEKIERVSAGRYRSMKFSGNSLPRRPRRMPDPENQGDIFKGREATG